MHRIETHYFTVIYIPFYFLQCAQQKRFLQRSENNNVPSSQLSFGMTIENSCSESLSFPVFEQSFANVPAALLDEDAIHVIELNHAA